MNSTRREESRSHDRCVTDVLGESWPPQSLRQAQLSVRGHGGGLELGMESTPSKALAPAHRLVYRGSLSLSDSHLLLDGLSFTVNAAPTHGSPALLNNTLALTLESLRGLPLHLIGTVRVKDVWIEPSPTDISMCVAVSLRAPAANYLWLELQRHSSGGGIDKNILREPLLPPTHHVRGSQVRIWHPCQPHRQWSVSEQDQPIRATCSRR